MGSKICTHGRVYTMLGCRIWHILRHTDAEKPPKAYYDYHSQLISIDKGDLFVLSAFLTFPLVLIVFISLAILDEQFILSLITLFYFALCLLHRTPNALYDSLSDGLRFPDYPLRRWAFAAILLFVTAMYLAFCTMTLIDEKPMEVVLNIIIVCIYTILAHICLTACAYFLISGGLQPHTRWRDVYKSPHPIPNGRETLIFLIHYAKPTQLKGIPHGLILEIGDYM